MEDIEVLRFDASCRVNHQDANIAILDAANRAHHTVELQVFAHLVFAANARSINEIEVETELVVAGVDTVASGACNVRHNVPFLADESVNETRLACIGPTHNGKTWNIFIGQSIAFLGELADDEVEQVACAATRCCGDALWLAKTESIELGSQVSLVIVHLVADEQDGLLRAAKYASHSLIKVCDAILNIDQEKNHIGLISCEGDLFADFFLEDVVAANNPATRIDDGELTVAPFALAVLTVASSAGFFADNGMTRLCQAVEKGAFAHIWTPHYSYNV